ncbi:hypothetical protein [Nocardia colli]
MSDSAPEQKPDAELKAPAPDAPKAKKYNTAPAHIAETVSKKQG